MGDIMSVNTLEGVVEQLAASTADVNRSVAKMSEQFAESQRNIERLFEIEMRRFEELKAEGIRRKEEIAKEIVRREKEDARRKKEEARREKEEDARREKEKTQREKDEALRREELERRFAENAREHQDWLDEMRLLSRDVGRLGNNLGVLVEYVVVPGIRPEFEKLGLHFTELDANKIVRGDRRSTLAELDLFLSNDTEAMSVEIKMALTPEKVRKHIEQLEKLRKWEDKVGIKDKTLYGAIVGVMVDEAACELALDSGLYAIQIHERSEQLLICKPDRRGTW